MSQIKFAIIFNLENAASEYYFGESFILHLVNFEISLAIELLSCSAFAITKNMKKKPCSYLA
jgi:hypothetical protein